MKKTILFITIILMLSCTCWDNNNGLPQNSSVQYVDTLKQCLLLDGKQVSVKDFDHAWNNYQLEYEFGSNGSRDALLRFGEKYSKGIYSFKIIKKND